MPWRKFDVNHGPDDLNYFSCFGTHLMTPFLDSGLWIEPSPLTLALSHGERGRERSFQGLRPADNIHQFFRNRGLPRFIVKQGDFLNEFSGISRCPVHRGHPSGLFGGRGF